MALPFYDPNDPANLPPSPFIFTKALGQRQPAPAPQGRPPAPQGAEFVPRGGYASPYAEQLARMEAQMNAPQTPTFTPEEQAQRRAQNQQEYQLGLLGMLSGDENLGNVGGAVFKQALANRQQRVTDKGTFDPITGEYKLNAEAKRENQRAQYERIQTLDAQAKLQWDQWTEKERQEWMRDRQRAADAFATRSLIAGIAAGNRADRAGDRADKDKIKNEDSLRNNFQAQTKDLIEQSRQSGMITELVGSYAGRKLDAQSQAAVIYMLNKFLDPNSVVREGEYDRVVRMQGLEQRAKNLSDRLLQGSVMSPEMVQQINQLATFFNNASTSKVRTIASQYDEVAERRGLDVRNIVLDPTLRVKPTAPGEKASNVVDVGAMFNTPQPVPANSKLPKATGQVSNNPAAAGSTRTVRVPY